MRKKIFSSVFAIALLATAGWGVNKSLSNDAGLSDLALSNVEALADGEVGIGVPCMQTCTNCWCYYPPIDIDPNDYWADGEPYV